MSRPSSANALIQSIRKTQTDLHLSDAELCAGGPIPASTWYQLAADIYPWPTTPKAEAKLLERLKALQDHSAVHVRKAEAKAIRARKESVNPAFIEFPEYAAITAAIDRAKAKGVSSEERLIIYVAPTRGGKTWTCDRLMSAGIGTWRVSGSPSWRSSYMALLHGLSVELKLPTARTCHALEGIVLDYLRNQSGVMLIEEIQMLSRDGKSFLKMLLNETPITLVLCMTPGFHRLMLRDDGEDLKQLLGRAEATILADKITPTHVLALSPSPWPDEEGPQVIANTANDLGGLSAVTRMLAYIARRGAPTAQLALNAAKAYRRAVPLPAPVR